MIPMRSRMVRFLVTALVGVCLAAGCHAVGETAAQTASRQTSGLQVVSRTLSEAFSAGEIGAPVLSGSLPALEATFRNNTPSPLAIVIPAGTLIQPAGSRHGRIVVLEHAAADLAPDEGGGSLCVVPLMAATLDMVPSRADAPLVKIVMADGELSRLIMCAGFARQPFAVQQFAVWTVIGNPAREAYHMLVDRSVPGGSFILINEDHITAIRALFEEAGIDSRRYTLFTGMHSEAGPRETTDTIRDPERIS